MIKSYRMLEFFYFLQGTFYKPKIRAFFEYRLQKVLKDESKKFNMNESNNFIMARLHSQNFMNTMRINLSVLGIVFFTGILWTLLVSYYLKSDEVEEDFISTYDLDS